MMIHELKILPEYFEAVAGGAKSFELRKDDRGFTVGDEIILKEWNGTEYTGRCEKADILHLEKLYRACRGVCNSEPEGLIILSFISFSDYDC